MSCLRPLVIALLGMSGSAVAASAVSDFTMGEVVVSAKKPVVESVTTVRTVTAEDIQHSGARTLDEAISLLPGVYVRVGGEGTPRIQVRGLQSRHIKLLINGIPANSTFDGGFDPTFIPVDQIAKIKLSAGSSSMLYGDGDLGGAINIITRKGAGPAHIGGAGVEVGQDNDMRGWGSVAGQQGALDYYFGVSSQARDGFRVSDDFDGAALEDGGLRENSASRRTHLYGNLGLTASDAWQFGLTLRHSEGQFGVPPSVYDATTDAFASKAKYERHENERVSTVQLNAEYAAGAWTGRGWVYYNHQSEDDNNYDDANYNTISDPSLKNTFLLSNETRITGAHVQVGYEAGAMGALTVAADSRREEWQQSGVLHDLQIKKKVYGTRAVDESRDVSIHSLAVEYAIRPIASTGITLGYSAYRQDRDDGDDQRAHGYLIGIEHALTDATRLRAAISQHVRFPTIRQLYDASSGDASLDRELARNKEIGISHRFSPDADVALTVFRNDVDNYIEKDENTNLYANFDHYRFSGVEINGRVQVTRDFQLRGGYTYTESKNLSDEAEFETLQYRPNHKLSLEALYAFGAGWNAQVSAVALNDQVYFSRTAPTQKAELNDIFLVNFKLAKTLGQSGASVYVGARNLFDENDETSYGLPQPGRFVYAGVEYGL